MGHLRGWLHGLHTLLEYAFMLVSPVTNHLFSLTIYSIDILPALLLCNAPNLQRWTDGTGLPNQLTLRMLRRYSTLLYTLQPTLPFTVTNYPPALPTSLFFLMQ